jgi:RHS repeat-associated protein
LSEYNSDPQKGNTTVYHSKWSFNKKGTYSGGERVYAGLYLGYRNGNRISRIGFDGPGVQKWHQSSGNLPVMKFYDVLNRVIREVSFGMNDTEIIYVDLEYDPRGRIKSQSEPYYASGDEVFYTIYEEYDDLDRPTKIKMPENDSYLSYIYYVKDGLSITLSKNQKGQTFTQKSNEIGQLVETNDYNKTKVIKEYFADGQIKSIKSIDPLMIDDYNNAIVYTYDSPLRRLKTLKDPARGLTSYDYNAYDEPTKVTHNDYEIVFNAYDKLGRLLSKTEHEGTYSYEFDTRPNGIGLISKMTGPGHSVEYFYDSFSRNSSTIETIFNEPFKTEFTYDVLSRPDLMIYPTSKLTIKNIYNEHGVLVKIINPENEATALWELEKVDARGNITRQQLAGSHIVDKTYFPETGRLRSIKSGNIQHDEYSWDKGGYLEWRKDVKRDLKESFFYDRLNRIEEVKRNNETILSMAYDKLGNIAYKSDVGYYEYSTSGSNPYKLVSINNKPPSINSFLQNVEYTSFNKVKYVSEMENGNIVHEMDLHYGVNKQRIKQVIDRHNTKIFVGNLYEKYISANETTEVFYIYSPDGLIAINTVTKNSNQLSVVLKDHLGSIQFIIDGNEFTEFSYDSYGSRRDPQTWLLLQNPVGFKLGIGFTGHEHLELFSIINMNGRIYDPVLGIFFTPDPLLQFPDLPIGLNPYSYCLNSPLSFVDPTGYSIDDFFFNFVRIMAMTVVTIGSGGNPLPAMLIATTFATMDGMHAMAKGANVSIVVDFILPSLVFTGTTAGIGLGIPSGGFLNEFLRASAHGINNGVARMASGGKFEHGFLSGFVSSLGGSYAPKNNIIVGVTTSAALGGTAEALGGGKFSNGAVTGAFVYLLNHAQNKPKRNVPSKEWLQNKVREAIEAEKRKIDIWIEGGGGDTNVDFNWEGYSNSHSAFNLYNDPITIDITLTIDGQEYPAVFRYNPSKERAANIVTDIRPAGRAGYYGHTASVKNMYHLWLNNARAGNQQFQIGFIYMKIEAYNAYLRYTNDE